MFLPIIRSFFDFFFFLQILQINWCGAWSSSSLLCITSGVRQRRPRTARRAARERRRSRSLQRGEVGGSRPPPRRFSVLRPCTLPVLRPCATMLRALPRANDATAPCSAARGSRRAGRRRRARRARAGSHRRLGRRREGEEEVGDREIGRDGEVTTASKNKI